jgi:hypothetical protein
VDARGTKGVPKQELSDPVYSISPARE